VQDIKKHCNHEKSKFIRKVRSIPHKKEHIECDKGIYNYRNCLSGAIVITDWKRDESPAPALINSIFMHYCSGARDEMTIPKGTYRLADVQ
jgi:hypothetical protein